MQKKDKTTKKIKAQTGTNIDKINRFIFPPVGQLLPLNDFPLQYFAQDIQIDNVKSGLCFIRNYQLITEATDRYDIIASYFSSEIQHMHIDSALLNRDERAQC